MHSNGNNYSLIAKGIDCASIQSNQTSHKEKFKPKIISRNKRENIPKSDVTKSLKF